ncbi:hypothetical protein IM697_33875 [Streptomyces ferrugineus]|uniref:Uncharacterized protein n=1 Tax=Streptomyces ferrugineus TaxID=1413221 RepID=A0A7M2SHW1_9ACTN|nr:hypothetical protein [Streptomyces ferrugineus]QOV35033.1 hypothetical protein IM697_33875 [Streptomyces ferrugineus]
MAQNLDLEHLDPVGEFHARELVRHRRVGATDSWSTSVTCVDALGLIRDRLDGKRLPLQASELSPGPLGSFGLFLPYGATSY